MNDNHQIRKLMDNIISKNFVDAKDNLHTILNQKVIEKVEDMKKDVVDQYYNFNESKLDPVGKEDDDVDNDGDSDSSDEYLKNRRKVISKAMKKDGVNEELYPDLKDTNQRILALLGKHSNVKHDLKWEKTTTGKYQVQIKPKSKGGFYGTYPGTPDGIYRDIQQDIESFKEGFNESEEVARIDLEMEKLKKKKERAQERDASKEGSSE